MKIYRSLDFKSQQDRIEKNSSGEYLVHAEDFESINDLVRRSLITRTKLPDFSSSYAQYDLDNEETDINQSQDTAIKPSAGSVEGERSEPATPPADGLDEPSVTQ